MLRQLGCEVQRPSGGDSGAEGQPFILVGQREQPMLFQMLIEFGYQPHVGDTGPTIRVVDRAVRSKEDVIASLTRPRAEAGEAADEGWPAVERLPRMRPEEEKELINRLVAPRKKSEQPNKEPAPEPPKFRSKAEQEASLERLLKKKTPAEADLMPPPPPAPSQAAYPASATRAASEGAAHRAGPRAPASGAQPRSAQGSRPPLAPSRGSLASASAVSSTWPAPAANRTHSASPSPSSKLSSSSQASEDGGSSASAAPTVRPSPRLTQAGLAAVSSAAVSSAALASAAAGGELPGGNVTLLPPLSPTGSPDLKPPASLCTEEALEQALNSDAARGGYRGGPLFRKEGDDEEGDWLDKLLGPAEWPGRAAHGAPKTKAEVREQRERIDKLAQPRKRQEPEPVSEEPKPKASARSQREACSRLAQPRAKKEKAKERESEAEEAAPTEAGGAQDEHEQEPAEFASADNVEEGEAAEEEVVVVPSLLAHCPRHLEPIDEERSALGEGSAHGSPARPKRRARSQPAPANPYAVPVVKDTKAPKIPAPKRTRGALERLHKGGSSVRPSEGRAGPPRSSSQGEEPGEVGLEGEDGEALLDNIDRLYGQLLEGKQAEHVDLGECGGDPEGALPQFGGRGPPLVPRTEEDMQRLSQELLEEPGDEDDEDLADDPAQPAAADMDRLYSEMIRRAGPSADAAAVAAGLQGRYGDLLGEAGEEEGDDPAVSKAAADLDRLYGALMHGSGAGATGSRAAVWEEKASTPKPMTGQELVELLEEVLYSAMLMGRGAGSGAAVQARLLELISPSIFAACMRTCGPGSLKPSLVQRLQKELPLVHAAVIAPAKPQRGRAAVAGPEELAEALRRARDALLTMACQAELTVEAMAAHNEMAETSGGAAENGGGAPERVPKAGGPSSVGGSSADGSERRRKSSKPRRSSMSYWTDLA